MGFNNGRHFAIAQGRKVYVRDLRSGKKPEEYLLSQNPGYFYLHPELDLLLLIDTDGVAHGLSLSTGKELYTFSHTGPVQEMRLNTSAGISDSKNNRSDQHVGISNEISKGANLITPSIKDAGLFPFGREAKVQITEKRDEQSKNSEIKIWDAKSGELQGAFVIDDATGIDHFTLNFNETLLAVAFNVGEAGLWDVKTFRQLSRFKMDGSIERFLFGPNNRYLATATGDDRLHIWDISANSMGYESGSDQVNLLIHIQNQFKIGNIFVLNLHFWI